MVHGTFPSASRLPGQSLSRESYEARRSNSQREVLIQPGEQAREKAASCSSRMPHDLFVSTNGMSSDHTACSFLRKTSHGLFSRRAGTGLNSLSRCQVNHPHADLGPRRTIRGLTRSADTRGKRGWRARRRRAREPAVPPDGLPPVTNLCCCRAFGGLPRRPS
jgi:hypothetical protein